MWPITKMQQIALVCILLIVLAVIIVIAVHISNKQSFEDNVKRKKVLNYDQHVKVKGVGSKSTGGGGGENTNYQGISFFDTGEEILGQRDPKKRIKLIQPHIDFKNKTVLDVGCNSGEVLFNLYRSGIKYGVGIDFDPDVLLARLKAGESEEQLLRMPEGVFTGIPAEHGMT